MFGHKRMQPADVLRRLQNCHLHSGCSYLPSRFAAGAGPEDPADDWRHEWEIDPATLEIGPKVGEGEFGTVHKVRGLPDPNLSLFLALKLDPTLNLSVTGSKVRLQMVVHSGYRCRELNSVSRNAVEVLCRLAGYCRWHT